MKPCLLEANTVHCGGSERLGCFREYPDLFRSVPICSDFFRFVPICFQNREIEDPFLLTPFTSPRLNRRLYNNREEHSTDQYRSRLKLSENFERHWSILISGEMHMDQSLVHTFSWGNSYGPMVLKVLPKFSPTPALVHGRLFPEQIHSRGRNRHACSFSLWKSFLCLKLLWHFFDKALLRIVSTTEQLSGAFLGNCRIWGVHFRSADVPS